jgi:hypothetical protein
VNVKLHIERLVIDEAAFAPGAGRKLQAAVETELTRLLTLEGLSRAFHSGGATPDLRVESIRATARGNPTRFGIEIARAVHGGLKNPDKR